MQVEFGDQRGQLREQTTDRLVVRDRLGQAVVVVLQIADGAIFVARPHEKGFREGLEMLGISQQLEVEVGSSSASPNRSIIERV